MIEESNDELLNDLKNKSSQTSFEINEADSKVLALSSMIQSLEKDIVLIIKILRNIMNAKT